MTNQNTAADNIKDLRLALASLVPDTGTKRYDHVSRLNRLIAAEKAALCDQFERIIGKNRPLIDNPDDITYHSVTAVNERLDKQRQQLASLRKEWGKCDKHHS